MILFIGNALRTRVGQRAHQVPLDLQAPVTSFAKDQQAAAGVAAPARRRATPRRRPPPRSPLGGAERGGHLDPDLPGRHPRGAPRATRATSTPSACCRVACDPAASSSTSRWQPRSRPGSGTRSGCGLVRSPRRSPSRSPGSRLITAPDQVFQPLNPLLGPAPAQPPQNAAIMLTGTFARTLAPRLSTIATGASGASAQPGSQTGTQWQVQAQLDRGPLASGSPSTAYKRATQTVNRIQSRCRARSSSSTTSPTRSTPPRATRSTPRPCSCCWRSRAP